MELELIEAADRDAAPTTTALQARPSATPADLVRYALDSGADVDRLERLMAMQIQWEAREARKAYDEAFAAFKAEAVTILKNRQVTDGPLKNKRYAELHAVVNAVTPALSRHGLSSSWRITRDDKDWIEVTCTLKHTGGHQETVSMGGPPDTGGAKNPIQARASTVSYLERYTLKAITGLSEQDDDDDGGHGDGKDWVALALAAETTEDLEAVKKDGAQAFAKAKDVPGYAAFMRAVGERSKQLKGAKA